MTAGPDILIPASCVPRKGGIYAQIIDKDYATLTDEQAKLLLQDFLNIELDQLNLKEAYVKKFRAVLAPKKVARYFQIENKMQTVMDYDRAKKIPVVR
jgi:hypothetical protein